LSKITQPPKCFIIINEIEMEFFRKEFFLIKERLAEKRKFIQVIVGPRQVGKTTLINQLILNENILFHYETADSEYAVGQIWISQVWQTARIKLHSSRYRQIVLIIDEIQKIHDWSAVVKKEWDSDTKDNINVKVILLGSSTLLIQKGLTESLAGRFELIHMQHWSYFEIHKAFGVSAEEFAWFGGYPGSYSLVSNEQRWKDYIKNSLIETTVSKDILFLNRIAKPALLKNLFELGCLYSGKILSFTKMLGQLQDAGNTVTLSHYLNLLDKASLLSGIEKYSVQNFRQRASSPKFQVYNTALISSQKKETFEEIIRQPEKWGTVIETAVGAHLINNAKSGGYNVFYWRHVNHEVDFVLKYNDEIIGIEIKSGKKVVKQGMEQFQKLFNPNKVLLVGTSGIPWQDFLKISPLKLFSS